MTARGDSWMMPGLRRSDYRRPAGRPAHWPPKVIVEPPARAVSAERVAQLREEFARQSAVWIAEHDGGPRAAVEELVRVFGPSAYTESPTGNAESEVPRG